MICRMLILSGTLLVAVAVVASASRTEVIPARTPLAEFPMSIGEWRGRDEPRFPPEILAVLGVDEYVNRLYRGRTQGVGLYIGYYGSQRQGDTIHSPMNCLPAAGWEPVVKEYIQVPVMSGDGIERTISINRYVIEKGLSRSVVLYWYQSHGRVIANEYRSKISMVIDAVRLNRTDAALVRVVSPILGPGDQADEAATRLAVDFVRTMFPLLDKYLPS
jgi:EpsI family protein